MTDTFGVAVCIQAGCLGMQHLFDRNPRMPFGTLSLCVQELARFAAACSIAQQSIGRLMVFRLDTSWHNAGFPGVLLH